jgi:hypothetical protein
VRKVGGAQPFVGSSGWRSRRRERSPVSPSVAAMVEKEKAQWPGTYSVQRSSGIGCDISTVLSRGVGVDRWASPLKQYTF